MDDTSRFENVDRAVKAIGELRERIQAAMLPVNTNNGIRDIILSSFTGGQAYVNNHIPAVAQPEAARPEEPTSLFIQDNEGSEYEEPDGDYDDDGGEEVDIDCDVDTLVTWLNSLAPQIVSIVPLLTPLFVFTNILQKVLHAPPEPGFPTPCPKLTIEPQSHQYRALGLIERSRDIPTKAMFIADPPGLGKTLPAMMAIVKSIPTARRFPIVVAPASCVTQWYTEFQRFFQPVGYPSGLYVLVYWKLNIYRELFAFWCSATRQLRQYP